MSESLDRVYNWLLKNVSHTTPVDYLKDYVKSKLPEQIKGGSHYEDILNALLKKERDKKGVNVLTKDDFLKKFNQYKSQYNAQEKRLRQNYRKQFQDLSETNPEETREKGFTIIPEYNDDLNDIKNGILTNISQETTPNSVTNIQSLSTRTNTATLPFDLHDQYIKYLYDEEFKDVFLR